MAVRRRLDAELVRRGMARSRAHADELIAAGRVKVSGATATKSATQVEAAAALHVVEQDDDPGYVSRGGHKLAGALEVFTSTAAFGGGDPLTVTGRRALDAGASTGGFTDVLLRSGVRDVIAVDVGYGQLAWRLRQDERVVVMERVNVRELTAADLPHRPDLIVADLSFISLRVVLPALTAICEPDADLVLMVKPQFEVGKERLGRGGVVREVDLRAEAVTEVAEAAASLGFGTAGVCASPLPGPSGNVEFFLRLQRGAPVPDGEQVLDVVRRAGDHPQSDTHEHPNAEETR